MPAIISKIADATPTCQSRKDGPTDCPGDPGLLIYLTLATVMVSPCRVPFTVTFIPAWSTTFA
jgi:hypothetical protein